LISLNHHNTIKIEQIKNHKNQKTKNVNISKNKSTMGSDEIDKKDVIKNIKIV